MMAISGKAVKDDTGNSKPDRTAPEIAGSKQEVRNATVSYEKPYPEPEKKTIVLKRKTILHSQENLVPGNPVRETAATGDRIPEGISGDYVPDGEPDEMRLDLKEPGFRVKDEIFEGKKIRGSTIPKVRDGSLMHTSLKQKRTDTDAKHPETDNVQAAEGEVLSEPLKKDGKKISNQDDISWI